MKKSVIFTFSNKQFQRKIITLVPLPDIMYMYLIIFKSPTMFLRVSDLSILFEPWFWENKF